MSQPDFPITPAIRLLRVRNVSFVPQFYTYAERGGTKHSAEELGVDEHCIIKTLVMESDPKHQLIVLMHGDREVSTKALARILGVKQVTPCSETTAMRVTGYQFGGTSPLGTRQLLPIFAEKTIFDLPSICINGGKRGFLVEMKPDALKSVLNIQEVDVAIEK
jgi:Cys-tRNA(Pro) deacylase